MARLSPDIIATGLGEAIRIKNGYHSTATDLADAPTLTFWAPEPVPDRYYRLVGVVSGHPSVPDGWCTTSVVLANDPERTWARTVSRYYKLATPLGDYWT